jgi:hypothetical protein
VAELIEVVECLSCGGDRLHILVSQNVIFSLDSGAISAF